MRGAATQRIHIPVPQRDVYARLQDVAGYGAWMRDVRQVDIVDHRRSVWAVHGPEGPMTWNAEITIERPYDGFAFCHRSDHTSGYTRVRLRPEGRTGTELTVQRFLGIRPGPQAKSIRDWWGDPSMRLRADLAHLSEGVTRMVEDRGAGMPMAVGFRPRLQF